MVTKDTIKYQKHSDVAVGPTSEDTGCRLYPKGMKRIIPILPFRDFYTVISCSNTNVLIVRKGFHSNRSITAV